MNSSVRIPVPLRKEPNELLWAYGDDAHLVGGFNRSLESSQDLASWRREEDIDSLRAGNVSGLPAWNG